MHVSWSSSYETHTHYRCVFDIRRHHRTDSDWTHLLKAIRRWITTKEPRARTNERFGGAWFFVGGDWSPDGTQLPRVQTLAEANDEASRAWALQYQHLDAELPERVWTTDVGIEPSSEEGFRLSVRVAHSLRPTFVGKEPAPPAHSAPRLVRDLLASPDWHCSSGSVHLTPHAHVLAIGKGHLFRRSLFDSARACPIVFASCDRTTGRPLIDVQSIARLLAGNANVLYAASSEVDEELSALLPNPLRCVGGMVRVYLPSASERDADPSGRPHRYFSRAHILADGEGEIERQIVSALSRRFPSQLRAAIENLSDVGHRNSESKVKIALKRVASGQTDLELELAMYKEEYDKLAKEYEVLLPLREHVREMEEDAEQLRGEIEQERAEARYTRQDLTAIADDFRTRANQLEAGLVRLRELDLPSTLEEMLDWISALFPDRVEFSTEARESAREAGVNEQRGALKDMWEVLRSLVSVLPRLAFDESWNGDLPTAFKNETGWDLTLTEGSMTRKDPTLMHARRITYRGQEIDISPHVKYGNRPPACARIHFYLDRDRQVIVIGHCGDHLTTAGTRRRR